MAANEWKVVHGKHQIRIVKTSSDGARLYVDNELVDTTNDLYASGDEATLAATFGESAALVEVFMDPCATQVAIRADGEWILKDQVYAAASD